MPIRVLKGLLTTFMDRYPKRTSMEIVEGALKGVHRRERKTVQQLECVWVALRVVHLGMSFRINQHETKKMDILGQGPFQEFFLRFLWF
jgi:hypothetical protein